MTAGKLMDAIVVDTKHVASECIRYSLSQTIFVMLRVVWCCNVWCGVVM